MNKTMTQSTQLKLLKLTNEIEKNRQALKGVLDNDYIGFGGYDLSETITDLECIITRLKRDVLQMDEDDGDNIEIVSIDEDDEGDSYCACDGDCANCSSFLDCCEG